MDLDSGTDSHLPLKREQDQLAGSPPCFVSLGMIVLDELQFPSTNTLYDIPGGSGAYSTLGARLATPGTQSTSIGWLVLAGEDFPPSVLHILQTWNVKLDIRNIVGQKSTRGLLKYEDDVFGQKSFRYTTPPLQPSAQDLKGTELLHSAVFHLLARPEDLEVQIPDLLSLRTREKITLRPLLVWEPSPPYCKFAGQKAHLRACKLVDVVSPNHLELMQLFEDQSGPPGAFDRERIEGYARKLLSASLEHGGRGAIVVIRAGEHGCLSLSPLQDCRWFPPYYDFASEQIVDPTGAGNTFVGAFGKALSHTDLTDAIIHGSVAASFALEQIGLPQLRTIDGGETWNGVTFESRLNEYRHRVA